MKSSLVYLVIMASAHRITIARTTVPHTCDGVAASERSIAAAEPAPRPEDVAAAGERLAGF